MNSEKIALIILNWNGKKDTLSCLASVANIDYPYYETIVVDNGSTDGSVAAIREAFPHITLIQSPENLGFAQGNNLGLHYALKTNADYFFLLNNDTEVDPQILRALIDGFQNNPQAGILGTKIYLFDQPDTLDHLGGTWNSRKASFDLVALRAQDNNTLSESPQEIDYVCGAGFMISRKALETIGLFEKNFFLIWEEADLCFRARRAGFKVLTCPQAKIRHKVSASFTSRPHLAYFWWRGRLLWISRNCSWKEKLPLYFKVLLPEILHLYKLQLLKSLQFTFSSYFFPKKDHSRQENFLKKNKAALKGVSDYFLRRFGKGPSWLYPS